MSMQYLQIYKIVFLGCMLLQTVIPMKIRIKKIKPIELSSTMIREKIKRGENVERFLKKEVLEYISSISNSSMTKDEVIALASENINEIQKIAENTIHENGYNYSVKLNIGNFSFPTKKYGDITFPAGFYDALKIEIGEAKGHNWWCVMFPPLCFVDVTSGIVPEESKQTIRDNLSEEEYKLLSENSGNMNFKFKIVEMFQDISIKLAQS